MPRVQLHSRIARHRTRASFAAVAVGLIPAITLGLTITGDDADAGFYSQLSSATEGVAVLMYHGLDPGAGANYNPESFRVQMDYLVDNGFHTITLDHLKSWIQTGSPALPPRPVVLTFDDNYLTIYTVAYPALKERGLVGINYAHTAYVGVAPGGSPATSFDHADWNEINLMEDDGVIFTESHTVWHRNLTTLNQTQRDEDIITSKDVIEAMMPGKVCRHFSYPFGGNNATVRSEVAAAGYETAVTTVAALATRSTALLEIPRFGVNPNTDSSTTLNSGFLTAVNAVANLDGGPWTFSNAQPGHYGSGYHYTTPGSGAARATWTVTVPTAGDYEVFALWTVSTNRATNAPYTITHAGGETTVRVNQKQNNGIWVSLGVYTFAAGEQPAVRLTNDADGFVIADAVQLVGVSGVGTDMWMAF